jgi:hypothetical protein
MSGEATGESGPNGVVDRNLMGEVLRIRGRADRGGLHGVHRVKIDPCTQRRVTPPWRARKKSSTHRMCVTWSAIELCGAPHRVHFRRAHGLDPRRDSLDRTAGVVVAGDHEDRRGDVLDIGHRIALSVRVRSLVGAPAVDGVVPGLELGLRGPVRRHEVARGDTREDRAESIRVSAGVEARQAPAQPPAVRAWDRSSRPDQRIEAARMSPIPARARR